MKKLIDSLVLKFVSRQKCPACQNTYGSQAQIECGATGQSDKVVCGSCGEKTDLSLLQKNAALSPGDDFPDDPVPEPPQKKLRHFLTVDGDFGLDIPRSGKSGFLLPFALLWIAVSSFIFLTPLLASGNEIQEKTAGPFAFAIFASVFIFAGVFLLVSAIKMKYTRFRLFLTLGKLIYQSELFGWRKTIQIPCEAVSDVGQKVFYTQNYCPVRGIEILCSDGKKIRFGTHFDNEIKRWIVYKLREELRARGNRNLTLQTSRKMGESTNNPQ